MRRGREAAAAAAQSCTALRAATPDFSLCAENSSSILHRRFAQPVATKQWPPRVEAGPNQSNDMVSSGDNRNDDSVVIVADPSSVSYCNASSLGINISSTLDILHARVDSPCISEKIHHSMEQDVALNDASRDPTSSSIVSNFCLMAKALNVCPTLNPNVSHDDDVHDNEDEDNDQESDNIASLKLKGELIFKALNKNNLGHSNFMEIMSISIEGKKYIEELEAQLKEHENTICY
ncbi:hypothetical protein D1007_02138 [Hordeum vulgare]|nr:hypothetical protein D1007_02138 [Hordeum vulgare]